MFGMHMHKRVHVCELAQHAHVCACQTPTGSAGRVTGTAGRQQNERARCVKRMRTLVWSEHLCEPVPFITLPSLQAHEHRPPLRPPVRSCFRQNGRKRYASCDAADLCYLCWHQVLQTGGRCRLQAIVIGLLGEIACFARCAQCLVILAAQPSSSTRCTCTRISFARRRCKRVPWSVSFTCTCHVCHAHQPRNQAHRGPWFGGGWAPGSPWLPSTLSMRPAASAAHLPRRPMHKGAARTPGNHNHSHGVAGCRVPHCHRARHHKLHGERAEWCEGYGTRAG